MLGLKDKQDPFPAVDYFMHLIFVSCLLPNEGTYIQWWLELIN